MFQSGQDDLFTSFLDFAGEKDLVEDGIDLVKVEDEIEFTDIAKELIEDLDKEMDGFEIGEFVVVGVDTDTEEQAGVAAVDDLGGGQVLAHQRLAESRVGGRTGRGWRGAEFDKVGLVFLVAWCDQAVDLEAERKKGHWSGRMDVLIDGSLVQWSSYLGLQFHLLFIRVWSVPFGEPGLALSVLDDDEGEHHVGCRRTLRDA